MSKLRSTKGVTNKLANDARANSVGSNSFATTDAPQPAEIHLLNVGPQQYGDSILCRFGNVTVLFDGAHPGNWQGANGHPSIPEQLAELLNAPAPPYEVDLLVVTHAHDDHIGCLPRLVDMDLLRAEWALVADPDYGFGYGVSDSVNLTDTIPDARVRYLLAAFHEEPRFGLNDNELASFMDDAGNLYTRYTTMLKTLKQRGTKVVRYGRGGANAQLEKQLLNKFKNVGLKILGPRKSDLEVCARRIAQQTSDLLDSINERLSQDFQTDALTLYREYVESFNDPADASQGRPGPYVNYQSIVTLFQWQGKKFLFTGDRQVAASQTTEEELREGHDQLLQEIENHGPYDFVKLAHHGAWNGFSEDVLARLGDQPLLGICAGTYSEHHPSESTLQVLKHHRDEIQWVRTDKNGQSTITYENGEPSISLSQGKINDWSPPEGATDADALIQHDTEIIGVADRAAVADNEIKMKLPGGATRVTVMIDLKE